MYVWIIYKFLLKIKVSFSSYETNVIFYSEYHTFSRSNLKRKKIGSGLL